MYIKKIQGQWKVLDNHEEEKTGDDGLLEENEDNEDNY